MIYAKTKAIFRRRHDQRDIALICRTNSDRPSRDTAAPAIPDSAQRSQSAQSDLPDGHVRRSRPSRVALVVLMIARSSLSGGHLLILTTRFAPSARQAIILDCRHFDEHGTIPRRQDGLSTIRINFSPNYQDERNVASSADGAWKYLRGCVSIFSMTTCSSLTSEQSNNTI
ncbi:MULTISPECIES: hypothetical protein [unclassified Bradyrhizobium]|uniref:hypothetical protein n=1 Tax=unclassified Bradyrhizobium TaxID=2631580 RepID=UPI0024E140AC|nr:MULTISPECIES: hypothetical protein [unclassified Bradyrhizobium]